MAAVSGDLAGRADAALSIRAISGRCRRRAASATPLTLSESYEFAPVWSHDGKSIAFASDRYGNFDVFVMPRAGGEAKRLTSIRPARCRAPSRRTTRRCCSTRQRQDLAATCSSRSGWMSELYSVPVAGGRVSQVLTTPAFDATVELERRANHLSRIQGLRSDWRSTTLRP